MKRLLTSIVGFGLALPAFAAPAAIAPSQSKAAAAEHIAQSYASGITVTTSNVFDLRSAFDGSDLLTNLPSMNEDMLLLQQHQTFNNILPSNARFAYPHKALLEISGDISATDNTGYSVSTPISNATRKYYNELYLDDAKLDFNAFITPWLGAFLEVGKDSEYSYTPGITRGWLTIGNLNVSPVYFTAGYFHLPFGEYSSAMVTNPVTTTMFRITDPAVLIGYVNNGLYAQGYLNSTDKSGAISGNDTNDHVSFGANAGYKFTKGRYSLDLGLGYNYNVNDAGGFQPITGDMGPWSVLDVHGEDSLQLTNWKLGGKAEFITTLGKSPTAPGTSNLMLTFNNKAAQPMALHVEMDANTNIKDRPFGLFLAYDQTWQAVGLNSAPVNSTSGASVISNLNSAWTNIPQRMVATGFNVSIWQDTIFSMEYRHNFTYKAQGIGAGAAATATAVTQNGTQEDIVTAKISAYF